MPSILRRLLRRHTAVVAYLGLFAALGGSAYAAVTVTGKNIQDGTVTGRDVENRSLGAGELSASALSSLTGRPGPAGDAGARGPQGPEGPRGASGISGWQYVTKGQRIYKYSYATWSVSCPDGKKALGGGVASGSDAVLGKVLLETAPYGEATGWYARVLNDGGDPITEYVWAICAYVSSN